MVFFSTKFVEFQTLFSTIFRVAAKNRNTASLCLFSNFTKRTLESYQSRQRPKRNCFSTRSALYNLIYCTYACLRTKWFKTRFKWTLHDVEVACTFYARRAEYFTSFLFNRFFVTRVCTTGEVYFYFFL